MGRSYATNNMSGKEKSNFILDIQASHDEAVRRKREYLYKKDLENKSPKGVLQSKVREATQKASLVKAKANQMLFDAAKQLKADIVELLKSVMFDDNGVKKELSNQEFFETIKYFDMPFTNLKSLSDMIVLGTNKYTEYENLFYDLMNKVDMRFALLAPRNSLIKNDIKFSHFPEDCKEYMVEHLEELNLTRSSKFLKPSGKYFEAYLNKGLEV